MKAILAAAALLALAAPVSAQCARGGSLEWRKDIEAALRESRDQSKPAMLYFTAVW